MLYPIVVDEDVPKTVTVAPSTGVRHAARHPTDPNSFNLAAALSAVQVAPATFLLSVNTVDGQSFRLLTVAV